METFISPKSETDAASQQYTPPQSPRTLQRTISPPTRTRRAAVATYPPGPRRLQARFTLFAAVITSALLWVQALQAQTRILFVGNSFTYGQHSNAHFFEDETITDENGFGYGGVPAIFKKLTSDAGLDYDVHIEAVGGRTLQYHLNNKASIIGQKWDIVVLQGLSTEPTIQAASQTPGDTTGNRPTFIQNVQKLERLIHTANPAAKIYLYETWARANLTYPPGTPYFGQSIFVMGHELHDGYYAAFANDRANLAGVVPCGDAWMRAWREHLAVVNPYAGYDPAKIINLWGYDYYHGSDRGYYLNALLFFGKITGRDPRVGLSGLDGTVPGFGARFLDDLGISGADATTLQNLAYEQLNEARDDDQTEPHRHQRY